MLGSGPDFVGVVLHLPDPQDVVQVPLQRFWALPLLRSGDASSMFPQLVASFTAAAARHGCMHHVHVDAELQLQMRSSECFQCARAVVVNCTTFDVVCLSGLICCCSSGETHHRLREFGALRSVAHIHQMFTQLPGDRPAQRVIVAKVDQGGECRCRYVHRTPHSHGT